MSTSERGSVSVASRKVIAPSIGAGTLILSIVLALGAGTILGGIVIPFLRADPPDQSQTEKLEAQEAASRAVLFSMSPQTIYAPLRDGGDLVSTGFSVEQYLTELEVRASQSGLAAEKIVTRKGDQAEISYVFSETNTQSATAFPPSKTVLEHPKTLVLTFASGPLPGTIALQKARVDGRERRAGASFVDFVQLGATPPELGEGQFLTPRGVFEIKLNGDGVAAFLDGVMAYPAPAPSLVPKLALPGGTTDPARPSSRALPRRLALQSYQPAKGILKDRLILIASQSAEELCAAKAIILDVKRGSVIELPEPLETPAVAVTSEKDVLVLNGFCAPSSPPSTTEADATNSASPATPAPKIRLSARYDLKMGMLTWQRETIVVDPLNPLATLDATQQAGASNLWREMSQTRLASPLVSGGALVSVACRGGGGVTLAVAGLPAPADGQAGGLRFEGVGGSASAQMRWRPTVMGYELDSASRPNEARAVLDRLRAGGEMRISTAGTSKTVPAPGRAQIDRLMSQCNSATTIVASPATAPLAKPPAKPVNKASAPRPPAKAELKSAAKTAALPTVTPTKAPPKPIAKAPPKATTTPAKSPAPKPPKPKTVAPSKLPDVKAPEVKATPPKAPAPKPIPKPIPKPEPKSEPKSEPSEAAPPQGE